MGEVNVAPQTLRRGGDFEQLHVQNVYDEIAPCMNDIEHKAWPNVKRFLKKMPPGALVADIGCGNGRYMSINDSIYKIGIDVCTALVDHARSRGQEVSYADNLHIPFRGETFDGVVSVGVIHHFCSQERRVAALRQLARILAPGGKLMLYVWAYEQKRRKFESQDVLIPWHESGRYGKRLGSASSTQSSIGGMSSTESVSEDDVTEQTDGQVNTPTVGTPKHQELRRHSSVSLDDISTVRDLADFKPSYYSLEFDHSPRHAQKSPSTAESYIWNEKKQHKLRHQQKDTLIRECRKLEASLRAMSSGSLDLVDLKASGDNDMTSCVKLRKNSSCENFIPVSQLLSAQCPKIKLKTASEGSDGIDAKNSNGSHLDLSNSGSQEESLQRRQDLNIDDNVNVDTVNSAMNVNLDWNLGELDYEDFEGEILGNEVIVDSGYSEKSDEFDTGVSNIFAQQRRKHCENNAGEFSKSGRKGNPLRYVQEDGHSYAKINPFLKQNSLEPYSFNAVQNISDESIEVIYENNEEFDAPDGVFVDFKQPRKSEKPEEKSFFNSVKSKLIGIFDGNKSNGTFNAIRRNENISHSEADLQMSVSESVNSPSVFNKVARTLSKPELTTEQLQLASKLNFQVREFPLSSCPDVVIENGETQPGTITTGERPSGKSNLHLGDGSSKDVEGLSNIVTTHSDDSGICEAIYDGYIKIDVDKFAENGRNGLTDDFAIGFKDSAKTEREALDQLNNLFDANINDAPKEIEKLNEKASTSKVKSCVDNSASKCNASGKNAQTNQSSQYCQPNASHKNRQRNSHPETPRSQHSGVNISDGQMEELDGDDSVFKTNTEAAKQGKVAENNIPRLCRYYHVFKEGELERLISLYVPDLHVVQSLYDHANWCIIAEKI